jgi:hypothetical protein
MSDVQTKQAILEQKLEAILQALTEARGDVRSLHDDHRGLSLQVAQLPLQLLEKGDIRYAPAGRLRLLERVFYGILTAVLISIGGLVAKSALEAQENSPINFGRQLSATTADKISD